VFGLWHSRMDKIQVAGDDGRRGFATAEDRRTVAKRVLV
jgi:hypothetical protein